MKRLLFLFMAMALVAFPAFSQVAEITFLHEGDFFFRDIPKEWYKSIDPAGFSSIYQKVIYEFEKANPGVKIRPMQSDLSSGSPITLDMMLQSGNPPDIVQRTGAMVAKLMNDTYAIQPDKYVSIADFNEDGLVYCRKNGKVYALPVAQSVSTLAVNLDHLAAINYTLPSPDKWTTDEYLALGKKLKASGKYLTALFAQNQSSDHWWMNWFMAFGAKVYTGGDYSRTTLNSPQGVAALKYMKQLVDEGLAEPNPSELNDDIVLDDWCLGKVTTLSMQIGHTAIMQNYAKQGTIAKEFAFTFVEFPHAVGSPRTPLIAGPTLVVGHKSGSEKKDALIAKFMLAVTSGQVQVTSGLGGNFPTSKSAIAAIKDPNPYWKTVIDIKAAVGGWDRGNTIPQFSEIRAVGFPLMQEFYAGRITAEETLKRYEAQVNAILKK